MQCIDVTVEEFSEYFSQLGNENSNDVNQDAESFCDNTNFNDNPTGVYEGLNDSISIAELLMAVNTLKQGKSTGHDSLLNEYLIESIDIHWHSYAQALQARAYTFFQKVKTVKYPKNAIKIEGQVGEG